MVGIICPPGWDRVNWILKTWWGPVLMSSYIPAALWYLRSTCYRSFFGRNWRHQKDASKLTDLLKVNEKERTHLLQNVVKKCINLLPQEISKEIFFLVASFVRKSLRIDMVEMLSDLNIASPFLWCNNIKRWDGIWGVGSYGYCMAEPIIQENTV